MTKACHTGGERSGGAIKFEVRTAHIEGRTGSVGLAAAVAEGSYSRTAVTVTIGEGVGLPQHRIRTDWIVPFVRMGVGPKLAAGLGHGSKYSRGCCLWQHLRVMTMSTYQ
jgi:hypothetical protein